MYTSLYVLFIFLQAQNPDKFRIDWFETLSVTVFTVLFQPDQSLNFDNVMKNQVLIVYRTPQKRVYKEYSLVENYSKSLYHHLLQLC